MSDYDADTQEFSWDLYSATVRAGRKIPIPEQLRSEVCIDSDGSPATWWGYDKETGYAFLASNYTRSDRYITVNNQSYKLEKGSRVTVPKPESSHVEKGVLGEVRPEEGDTVYFYADSRMQSDPMSTIVLSKNQLEGAFRPYLSKLNSAENVHASKSEILGDTGGTDVEEQADEILKRSFPVPK